MKKNIIIASLIIIVIVFAGYFLLEAKGFSLSLSRKNSVPVTSTTSTKSTKTPTTSPKTVASVTPAKTTETKKVIPPVTNTPDTEIHTVKYQQGGARINADGSSTTLSTADVEAAKKRILPSVNTNSGYENTAFTFLEGQGGYITYSATYQSNGALFGERSFGIGITDSTTRELALSGYKYYIDSNGAGPDIMLGNNTGKTYMSNGNAIPIWTSGKFVIRVNPNLPDADQVIKAWLAKYPPN